MSLQGNIEEMGLGAVIQTLSLNRYRGTLRIETEDGGSQFFFISEGEILLVRQVKRDPVRLGDLLVRAGKLAPDQLERALAQQRKQRRTQRLGKTLVDLELISQDEIEAAVREKFEEDFLDLFLLDKGRFEFIFGLTPEALFGPEEKLERVSINSSGIMLEAMKRLDEWEGIIQSLGSLDTIYCNRMESLAPRIEDYELEGVTLPANVRSRLYSLLDGEHTLRDVISTALREGIATRLQTFLFLHQLNEKDLVKPLDFKTLLAEAKKALAGGDVPATAKYIRAILCRKEKLDIGLIKRYLEFLVKYKRPRLAFDEARRFAAQALADDETDQAIALYEMAIAIDRNVEVIDRLFYALLRANKRQRAIEVGLELRDFLNSESELSVAVRVCKNLKELDPKNPEVLELSGLILKRQERNEEAVRELDQALARMGPEHPRRQALIEAILELQPDRNELRDEQASLELQAAELRLRREIRRRWLFVLGSVLLVLLAWRGYSEYRARVVMTTVRELLEEPPRSPDEIRRLGDKLQEVISYGPTTVRAEALAYQAENEKRWAEAFQAQARAGDNELKERAQAEQRKAEEEARRKAVAELRARLAAYEELRRAGKFEDASAAALALVDEYATRFPEEVAAVRVFVRVETVPPGCAVRSGGEEVGKTPCAVPVPPRGEATLTLALRGYRSVQRTVRGDGYATLRVELAPGPTWTADLSAPPLSVVPCGGGVAALLPTGEALCFDASSGRERWRATVQGEGTLSGAAAVESVLACGRGLEAVGLALRSGQEAWRTPLGETLLPPATARLADRSVALFAGGVRLWVLSAEGEVLSRAELPAPVHEAPVPGGTSRDPKAFVVLQGGVACVGLGPEGRDARTLWFAENPQLGGRVLYSRAAEAVLVPSGQRFAILDEERGKALGSIAPGFTDILDASLQGKRFNVLGKNGFLCALSAYNGDPLWPGRRVAKSASAGPLVLSGDLIVADGEGRLLRFSRDGVPRKTADIVLGAPVDRLFAEGEAIFALAGKRLYRIDLEVLK
ncbi:MAG: DUF4388 domain-containing protein [Planctomycetota bacterium]|nr:MAG: DUF4388 domain-containing protein [Planctomycetota bacterium]